MFASVVFAIGVVEYFIFEHTYDLLALIVAIVVLAILYAVGTLAEKGVES